MFKKVRLFSLFFFMGSLFFTCNILHDFMIASKFISNSRELPLHSVTDIVEYKNEIFVGLAFYGVIQVYDKKGKYKRSISVDNKLKNFSITISKFGYVSFFTHPGQKGKVYENGNFQVKVFPRKIFKVKDNNLDLVISEPLYRSVFFGQFNSFIWSFIFIKIYFLINLPIFFKLHGHYKGYTLIFAFIFYSLRLKNI